MNAASRTDSHRRSPPHAGAIRRVVLAPRLDATASMAQRPVQFTAPIRLCLRSPTVVQRAPAKNKHKAHPLSLAPRARAPLLLLQAPPSFSSRAARPAEAASGSGLLVRRARASSIAPAACGGGSAVCFQKNGMRRVGHAPPVCTDRNERKCTRQYLKGRQFCSVRVWPVAPALSKGKAGHGGLAT